MSESYVITNGEDVAGLCRAGLDAVKNAAHLCVAGFHCAVEPLSSQPVAVNAHVEVRRVLAQPFPFARYRRADVCAE